ncbi:flagellar basal body L-ring protein FlgH [Aureimonas leprariae]|uniref:Flagellar L-ring protein n=1 Tax=Plantimonas leprariae TaxID=2615207 RepID=A0A7V7TUR8_9HYPH|nr:flagellar basal body L-ring protein FlgH [Aureimonas leprariae]KAB0676518.1 flagellar basal body L-ring protein FlgH [Aureimonas leprariae]
MKRLCLLLLLTVGGCASQQRQDFMAAPVMTPPGAGFVQNPAQIEPAAFPAEVVPIRKNSLWTDGNANLFRDARALHLGDIVTVRIEIKDKAEVDNNTKRSRDSGVDIGADVNPTWNKESIIGALGGKIGLSSGTNSTGKGNVKRSEKIDLSVAAVVTQILPNGNLYITGQQEVRVNFEVRVLSIAGVIRPGDILPNNTIPYDRIAEARISYGGRGRLTEVQQPGWGQQALDIAAPW